MKAFKGNAKSFKIEIIDSKDPLAQLGASNWSVKHLFKDLLNEIKAFKYQLIVKVLLKKHKSNGHIEIAPVYFSCSIKTVINLEYDLDKSFQEILYRIDNCINEGSGWVIEWINREYVKIYIFSPLSGSSYIELPVKLRNSMKGLINMKINAFTSVIWDI